MPAGERAKGYIALTFNPPGTDSRCIKDIQKYVYGAGKGNLAGQGPHRRGLLQPRRARRRSMTVEAIRNAQAQVRQGKPLTGEQVRWGLENLNIDDARLKELGATGLMHADQDLLRRPRGRGAVKFQQWDGTKWNVITDWMQSDRAGPRR